MKPGPTLLLTLLAVVVGLLVIQTVRLDFARTDAWVADTTARNERARHATTRRQLVRVDGQVVGLASRLAEQQDVSRQLAADTGRLARALAQVTSGRASALALVQILGDSIARLQTGTAVVHGDTVQATDSLVVPGVTARATVTIAGVQATQPPPLLTRWAWDLTRAPLELAVLYECQGRDAAVHVAGPPWATVEVGRAVQDATFCNPKPRGWQLVSLRPPSLPWAAALLGVGYLLGH